MDRSCQRWSGVISSCGNRVGLFLLLQFVASWQAINRMARRLASPGQSVSLSPGNPAATRSMAGAGSKQLSTGVAGHRHCIHPARRLDQRRSSLLPATNSNHPSSPNVNKQPDTTIDFQPKPAISPFCITTTHRPIHLIKHSRCRVRQSRLGFIQQLGCPLHPPTYWSSPKLSPCYDVGDVANIPPPRQAALATTDTLQSSPSRVDCIKSVCLHLPKRRHTAPMPRPSTPLRPDPRHRYAKAADDGGQGGGSTCGG